MKLIRDDPRHEFVNTVDRVVGDAREYEAQIHLGIDRVEFRRLCRAPNYAE